MTIAVEHDDNTSAIRMRNHSPDMMERAAAKCLGLWGELVACQPIVVIVGAVMFMAVGTKFARDQILVTEDESTAEHSSLVALLLVSASAIYFLLNLHRVRSQCSASAIVAVAYLCAVPSLYAFVGKCGWAVCWFAPLLIDVSRVLELAGYAPRIDNGLSVLGTDFVLDSCLKFLLLCIGASKGIIPYASPLAVFVAVDTVTYLAIYPAALTLACEAGGGEFLVNDTKDSARSPRRSPTLPNNSPSPTRVRQLKVFGLAILLGLNILLWPAFATEALLGDSYPLVSTLLGYAERLALVYTLITLCNRFLRASQRQSQPRIVVDVDDEVESEVEKESLVSSKVDMMDRASDTTDSGISIRPLGNCGGGETWPGIEERSDKASQTPADMTTANQAIVATTPEGECREPRGLEECAEINRSSPDAARELTDDELVKLVQEKVIRAHSLEAALGDDSRAVVVRRKYIERQSKRSLINLPFENFDYSSVRGACCESVVGFVPIPVGIVGPLNLDGDMVHVPMVTTEGCLVASVNRGCSALRQCGVTTVVEDVGMTRGPVVRFDNIVEMDRAKKWLEDEENFSIVKGHFDSTSRFARLQKIKTFPSGRDLFIQFRATTGDAMGMNMVSKGTEHALRHIAQEPSFPEMEILGLSGNVCTDKKPAAINWLDGRGKRVVAEAVVPRATVEGLLKTTTAKLVELNKVKNLRGSAMAGSIGGFNAQAANVVTAIFLATGNDAAQNVASSNCMTSMEETPEGDLLVSTTMPSIEVGTVGGGTVLAPQSSCLNLLGVKGASAASPGDNARRLASVVCGTVLAGELSLMSALAAGHLVKSHMRHNRSNALIAANDKQPQCNQC